MDINWQYDNFNNGLHSGNIVTFRRYGQYSTGVISSVGDGNVVVGNKHGRYSVCPDDIIAWADFEEVVNPAKPKLPDGALSWDELEQLYSENKGHVWVCFRHGGTWPAIMDRYDNKLLVIWAASTDKDSWLCEYGYGDDYVCYPHKPNED